MGATRVRDPLRDVWWIHTRFEPDELPRRAQLPEYVAAMRYVQGAEIVTSAG